MATKKQKRAAAEAKHAKMMEEYRRSGLEAQRKDREERKDKLYRDWEEQHKKKHSWKKRVEECPWCKDELKLAREANREAQASATKQAS